MLIEASLGREDGRPAIWLPPLVSLLAVGSDHLARQEREDALEGPLDRGLLQIAVEAVAAPRDGEQLMLDPRLRQRRCHLH